MRSSKKLNVEMNPFWNIKVNAYVKFKAIVTKDE